METKFFVMVNFNGEEYPASYIGMPQQDIVRCLKDLGRTCTFVTEEQHIAVLKHLREIKKKGE